MNAYEVILYNTTKYVLSEENRKNQSTKIKSITLLHASVILGIALNRDDGEVWRDMVKMARQGNLF